MNTNLITIGLVTIHQDDDGRYSLNDLHKAAGGNPTQRPGEFLRLQQTQDLISELESDAGISRITAETGRDLLIEPGVKFATSNRLARLKAADLIEQDRSMGKPVARDELHVLEIEAAKLAATLGQPVSQVFDWLSDRLDVPSEAHIPRFRHVEAINLLQLRNEFTKTNK